MAESSILAAVNKLEQERIAAEAAKAAEQAGIKAAADRIAVIAENSGGTLETDPGVGSTREALDQTAAPTAKGKAKNESVVVTGA